ncbi:MAG: hypothetical protein NC098_06825 [Lachnoclostridium sp.]|nr:hypothetical protein [Lachnoclostridium sp.]
MGGISPQYSKAIGNARTLSEELGDQEISFVGHSMGGGQAAAASMATGYAAITFNPAALSLGTMIINSLHGRGDITNYISTCPGPFGTTIVSDYVTILQNINKIYAPGTNIPVMVNTFPSHGIDVIVNALRK